MADNNGAGDKPMPTGERINPKKGRPSKFTQRMADKLYHLASYGHTETEMAWLLDISPDSITKWKDKSEVFRTQLNAAKEKADAIAEQGLFSRCKPQKLIERTVERTKFEGGEQKKDDKGNLIPPVEKVKQTLVEKEIPADAGACKTWLFNRRPEKWKNDPNVVIQDNRQQLMINFNAEQVADLILHEYGNQAKLISNAISKVLGIPISEPADDTPREAGGTEGADV